MKPALLLGTIGVALLGVFGYHRMHLQQQEQGRLIQSQIAQEQTNQQAQVDAATALKQLEQYRKPLPPEPDPSWLVHEVGELAQKTGIQFTTLSQAVPQDLRSFTRMTITFPFTASYHQLGTFLNAIETAPMFMHIDHLEIMEPKEKDREEGTTAVRMTVSTVYLPPIGAGAK